MTGGLIQLVAQGYQNIFLTSDPQITFFKIVYRRHTNFTREEVQQNFIESPKFGNRATCVLGKRGDFVGNTCLVLTIPKIKKFFIETNTEDKISKIAWIKKIGFGIIKHIQIEIGGKIIDRQYGEWLNIWHELFSPKSHLDSLNKMIGNVPELTDLSNGKDEYTLYIPLKFWFCTNIGSSIPIICLQYSDVKISVEFSSIDDCYVLTPTHYIQTFNDFVNLKEFDYIEQTVDGETAVGLFCYFDIMTKRLYYKKASNFDFKSITSTSVSISDQTTDIFNTTRNFKYFIKNMDNSCFVMPKINSTPNLYLNPHTFVDALEIVKAFLLVDYYYVDLDERRRMLMTKFDYLIEQTDFIDDQIVESSNRTVNINFLHPVKYVAWVLQHNYLKNKPNNDKFNYTDSYIQKNGKSLIKSETILLNGQERVSKRSYQYFNHVQAYQHFFSQPSEGINLFSFCLHPNKLQPSGACNMSVIDIIQIDLSNSNSVKIKNTANLRTYGVNYNILRIINGLGGLVFDK
jgi:hypothetical protein